MKAVYGGLIWAALVACCTQAGEVHNAEHPIPGSGHPKPEDLNNLQMDGNEFSMVKRAWNNMPQSLGWGKRAWRNMPSAWGKRFVDPVVAAADKRAWQKFQAGWGKRWGAEDEWNLPENSENEPQQYDDYGVVPSSGEFEDLLDEDKRAWKNLNSPWGKRATHDWGSFRGSWGKRDPAWNNLKGLWGKRSIQDRVSS